MVIIPVDFIHSSPTRSHIYIIKYPSGKYLSCDYFSACMSGYLFLVFDLLDVCGQMLLRSTMMMKNVSSTAAVRRFASSSSLPRLPHTPTTLSTHTKVRNIRHSCTLGFHFQSEGLESALSNCFTPLTTPRNPFLPPLFISCCRFLKHGSLAHPLFIIYIYSCLQSVSQIPRDPLAVFCHNIFLSYNRVCQKHLSSLVVVKPFEMHHLLPNVIYMQKSANKPADFAFIQLGLENTQRLTACS